MRNVICSLFIALFVSSATAFVAPRSFAVQKVAPVKMGFGMGDEPPKKLTRDSEPDEFFATNMDKMSDEEKIPVAIAGLAFISLPFIAGLIALYASK